MAELLLILLHLKYRDKLHAKIITRRRAKEDAQKPLRASNSLQIYCYRSKNEYFPGREGSIWEIRWYLKAKEFPGRKQKVFLLFSSFWKNWGRSIPSIFKAGQNDPTLKLIINITHKNHTHLPGGLLVALYISISQTSQLDFSLTRYPHFPSPFPPQSLSSKPPITPNRVDCATSSLFTTQNRLETTIAATLITPETSGILTDKISFAWTTITLNKLCIQSKLSYLAKLSPPPPSSILQKLYELK